MGSNSEIETTICLHDGVADVWTNERPRKTRIRRLAQEHPDEVRILHEDPKFLSLQAQMPDSWVKLSPRIKRQARELSEEELEVLRERMRRMRSKSKGLEQ